MAYRRKRICAIRRAPDGSAFEKCNFCDVTVAIALMDMHKCNEKQNVKRSKCSNLSPCAGMSSFWEQPRSPFCIFMEEFEKIHENEDWIKIDRKGFQRWKDMAKEERHPYTFQAKVVNSAYEKTLFKERDYTSKEDDEADSATVGKFDLDYEDYYMYQEYDKTFESDDSFDYELYLAGSSFGEQGCHRHHGKSYQVLCVT